MAGDLIFTMIEDDNHNIWIGTRDNGISIYNGDSFTNYTIQDGLPNNKIATFCKDKQGIIWIGTYGGGLSCFDG